MCINDGQQHGQQNIPRVGAEANGRGGQGRGRRGQGRGGRVRGRGGHAPGPAAEVQN